MAIMHVDVAQGSSWEYMVKPGWTNGTMSATDLRSSGDLTGVKVSYPVDFWLYDTRVTLDFKSDAFAAAWPHPAVVAQQAARWPSGGHIYSYRHAATTLAEVGAKLAVAQKLHPVEVCFAREPARVHVVVGALPGCTALLGPMMPRLRGPLPVSEHLCTCRSILSSLAPRHRRRSALTSRPSTASISALPGWALASTRAPSPSRTRGARRSPRPRCVRNLCSARWTRPSTRPRFSAS